MLSAIFFALPLLLSSVVTGAPITSSTAPIAFVLLGDSTTYSANGWGNGFCSSLAQITTPYCRNYAVSGTTTGALLASQNFQNALATIRGFVAEGRDVKTTIQYGHNDQKIAEPESMGKNLTLIVDQVRDAGGDPILVTSLTRRNFNSDGTINDILGPWADETKRIASLKATHLIDLHSESIEYCEAIGPTAAHRLNGPATTDNTHLNDQGIEVFGRQVAILINSILPCVVLTKNATLDYNITHGIPSY